MKFKVIKDLDYVIGHLRYGHLEGVVEAESEEQLKELLKKPDAKDYLEVVIDDYEVEDYDAIGDFKYEVIKG